MTTRISTIQPRRLVVTLAILAGLLAALLSGATSKAYADGTTPTGSATSTVTPPTSTKPPSCAGQNFNVGTGTCGDIVKSESNSGSSSSVSSSVTSVDGIKIDSSTTVLSYIKAKGLTKSEKKGKVYKLKKKMTLRTSYYNIHHKEVWHNKTYPEGHKFYYSKKDKWYHDSPCGNKVKVPSEKKPVGKTVTGKVKIVKEFHFSGSATAKVSDYVTTQAKSWANTFTSTGALYCRAYGEGKSKASYAASATAKLTGSVYVSLEEAVKGAVKGANSSLSAKLKGKTTVKIRAELLAQANGAATGQSSSKAECSEAPAPINQPPSGDFKLPQHLYVGGTYCAKFYGSDPEDKGNVKLEYKIEGPAKFVGETDNCAYRDDVENSQRVITQPIEAGSTPGTVTVTLVVKDSKDLASSAKTFTFPVLADDVFPDKSTN